MKAVDLSPFKALTSPIHIRYCEKVCQSILYTLERLGILIPDPPEILSFRIFLLSDVISHSTGLLSNIGIAKIQSSLKVNSRKFNNVKKDQNLKIQDI